MGIICAHMIKTSTKNTEELTQPNIEKLFFAKDLENNLDLFYAGISNQLDKLSKEPRSEVIEKILFFSKNY